MKSYGIMLLVAGLCMMSLAAYAFCQPALQGGVPGPGLGDPILSEQSKQAPPVETVAPGIYKLGGIHIYKDTRSIVFPAQVNMDRGLLEYLIVRSSGKVHESLLRTEIEPFHLQLAFLLLGFEGTDRPIQHQGSPEIPTGDPVDIEITYRKGAGDQEHKFGAHEWVANRIGTQLEDVGSLKWVYTGSKIFDGRFLAQVEGSIVALWHDPVVLVDNASPGGESNRIWFSKEGTVPPVGTPVTVIIKGKK